MARRRRYGGGRSVPSAKKGPRSARRHSGSTLALARGGAASLPSHRARSAVVGRRSGRGMARAARDGRSRRRQTAAPRSAPARRSAVEQQRQLEDTVPSATPRLGLDLIRALALEVTLRLSASPAPSPASLRMLSSTRRAIITSPGERADHHHKEQQPGQQPGEFGADVHGSVYAPNVAKSRSLATKPPPFARLRIAALPRT